MTENLYKEILRGEESTKIVITAKDFKTILDLYHEKQQAEENESKYLTAQESAEFLRCDRATLWKREKAGMLLPTRLGRRVYYKKSDLAQCLERGRR